MLLINGHLPISLPHGRIAVGKPLERRNALSPSFRRPPNNTCAFQMHPGMSCKQDHKELSYSPPGFRGSFAKVAEQAMKTERLLSRTFTPTFLQHRRQTNPPDITAFLKGSAITPRSVQGMHPSERTTSRNK